MRFMVIVKASKDSEAGVMPSTELLTAMGKFNEELVKAGVMAADAALPASVLDPCALRARMQALARFHHAGLDQFLIELAHRGQQFRTRHDAGFRILAGLHNHHESHRYSPV